MNDLIQLNELSEHQKVLLSMLKDFDAVCEKHGIRYMLFAGTALGAVRHHGFIPWDDDADVIMMRSDYERFLNVRQKILIPKSTLFSGSSVHIGQCSFQNCGSIIRRA